MIFLLHLGGRGFPPGLIPGTQAVDKSRLSVDNWLSLWRSPPQAENERSSLPPYMGAGFSLLQDVERMRKVPQSGIHLWMAIPDSFHREAGFRLMEKPNI